MDRFLCAGAVEEAEQTLDRMIGEEKHRCRGVLCVGRDNQHQMAQTPPFVLNTAFLSVNVLRLGGFTPLSSLKFLLPSKFPAVSRTHILLIYSLFCLGPIFSPLLPAPTPFYHLLCEGI